MANGTLGAARNCARSVGAAFLDCFLPRFCAVCRARLSARGHLCAGCAALLSPTPFAFCPLCRFEDEAAAKVEWKPGVECPTHDGVAGLAGVHIGRPVLELVHRFKYSGEEWLARTLADLMPARAGLAEWPEGYDLMCPVPLYRARMRERGFNQSAELAALWEPRLGVPLVQDLLVKRRPTPEQVKLGGRARRANLEGCFAAARPSVISGRNVILVDDLVTTGSTASACIRVLRYAGARRVLVLAVAA
jgi:ComF family protein